MTRLSNAARWAAFVTLPLAAAGFVAVQCWMAGR
jgi:hypothetical protein